MRLQGAISPRVEARLDEMLGHPETCPHGNPIDAETARRRPAGVRLSEIEAGERATVYRITEEAEEDAGPALVPRGPGAHAGRPHHDPRPLRVARLADARRPARPGDAGPPAGRPRPGPPRRGRSRRSFHTVPAAAGRAPRDDPGRPRPRPDRPEPDRAAPHRDRPDGAVQLPARPARRRARSSSGSRTPTRPAARSPSRRTSSTASTGSGLHWDEGPEVAGEAARGPYAPVPPDAAPAALRGRRRAPARRRPGLSLLLHARGARRRPQGARRRPSCRRSTSAAARA